MKKFLACCLAALLLLLPLSGCSAEKKAKLNIVTTLFAPYDFARSLTEGMEDVSLSMLLKPGSEAHHFEPTPKDIITVQNADVFIYVGGESDAWVDTILDSIDTEGMILLTLMDCVELIEAAEAEHDHGDGDSHEYDEHIWTSPRNAMRICDKLEAALLQAAPEYQTQINTNAKYYQARLTELDANFTTLFSEAKRSKIVMGDRFPFLYFSKAYGMEYEAAFPSCASQSEPDPKTLAALIDTVKSEQIPVVFHMELSNEAVCDAICEATGAKKLQLHACHNITKADFDAGESYLSLMNQNLIHLQEALN